MHESNSSTGNTQQVTRPTTSTKYPDPLSDDYSDGWSNRGPAIAIEPLPTTHTTVRKPVVRLTGGIRDGGLLD